MEARLESARWRHDNVTDPDQLRELIPATRHGKDKKVHRILTSRRDELLAEIRNTQQLQSDLEEAATAIARHSGRPYDASYPTTLAQLEGRWCTLAPQAPPDLRSEVTQHLQRAHEVVVHHRQALEAETERQRSATVAAAEAQHRRELEAQAAATAAAEQARIRDAEREALREAEQAQRAADESRTHEILGLLRQARAALDHGGTARAARLRASITEKLPDAPVLPAWFARQLEQVDSQLAELQDWKTFRVVPKRAELVQQMQSLVGADLAPEELAQQIRQLRDEWRTLNRGAGEDRSDELQQFQDAADRAYEPCREHFARQAELRKENQERREALIERLTTFAAEQAGENPNWRSINQAIVESRREWRQHAPVDQAIVKPLQARFHALVGELQARLDAEYARNVQTKRDLIARTSELLSLEDTRKAIDETMNLQRTWKTVGIVPRNLDNVLWDEFRQQCDAVFQRSSQESAAYAVTLEANQAQATGVCDELERIAGLTDESLLSAVPQLDELCAKFESLDLPRASARALQQRFSHATDRCAEAVRRHRATAARRGWTDGFTAAARIRAYSLATVQGRSPTECEALLASAASAIADLAHAPKAMRSILEQRLAAVAAGKVNPDVAANEAALRLLCIRAELIAGASTPPDDLELRREYQMRRLVETMGHGERVTPAELDDLALEWIAIGPVEPAVHDALLARFERCRTAS